MQSSTKAREVTDAATSVGDFAPGRDGLGPIAGEFGLLSQAFKQVMRERQVTLEAANPSVVRD